MKDEESKTKFQFSDDFDNHNVVAENQEPVVETLKEESVPDEDLHSETQMFSEKHVEESPTSPLTEPVQTVGSGSSVTEEKRSPFNTYDINRVYIGFQTRVGLLITGILILFGLACFMIISTLQNFEVRKVDYSERSVVHYEVCPENESSTCIKEDQMYYENNTSKVHVNYQYEARFAEKGEYDLTYSIVVVHKIFDRFDSNKISYEQEDVLLEKQTIHSTDDTVKIDVKADVDYRKYRQFVDEYKKKYSDASDSTISVMLYIDDGLTSRSVGDVVIPMVKDQFHIKVHSVKNSPQVYSLQNNNWSKTNTIYIVVGCILVLLSLFLLFHLTKLVMAVAGKKSKYNEYLLFLLNEYDRLIVNATDDFTISMNKKLIKVYTFEELLEIRSVLNKPIIYSKINNVKSEFVVEDEEVVYKYVLKEADVGE